MTWVIGTSFLVGQAVLISDIQVRFSDGSYRDLLQKGYYISNHVAAGFAGSVKIGFGLLDRLAFTLSLTVEQKRSFAWDPTWIAANFPSVAREEFNRHSLPEQKLGSEFLVVTISPTEHRGVPEFPTIYLLRFKAPHFKAGIVKKGFSSISIGSGASEQHFKRTLSDLTRFGSNSLQAEVGNKFGWADLLCWSLSRTAIEKPVDGVSCHFNLLAFDRGNLFQGNSDHKTHWPDGTTIVPHLMPPTAKSYSEFLSMCKASDTSAEAAVC